MSTAPTPEPDEGDTEIGAETAATTATPESPEIEAEAESVAPARGKATRTSRDDTLVCDACEARLQTRASFCAPCVATGRADAHRGIHPGYESPDYNSLDYSAPWFARGGTDE